MAVEWQLLIDGKEVPESPLNGSYSCSAADVANEQETEAGTTVREVVRARRHVISADFVLDENDMAKLGSMVANGSMDLACWIPEDGKVETLKCYLSSGFKPSLMEGGAFYKVSLEWTEF
jgi:hypothetical protein